MQQYALVFVIFVCLWGIASPRVHTGTLITAGLLLTASGCLAMFDAWSDIGRAVALQTYGLVLIGWGVAWRFLVRPWWLRAAVHWRPVAASARFWGIAERRDAEHRPTHGRKT